jgi:plastocyanin
VRHVLTRFERDKEEVHVTRHLKWIGVLTTAVMLSACGGNGNGGGGEEGGGGASTLSMVDNAFQPAALTVSAGAELELTNDGQALHNLTIEGTDVNEDVEAGQSTTVSIDIDPGDYTMFCEYHRTIGMEGTVTVQ